MDEEIRALAAAVSARLVEQGAKATLLTGSHARGHARPDSDIDIFAVGDGPSGWMELVDSRLVAVYWWSPEEIRRRMLNPEEALLAVRSWREGALLDDPTGVGAELQREAREWTWNKIEREADAWVADKLVVWAEYVQKLARAVESGRRLDAAALRAQLAVQLSELIAVRRRLMEQSENGFWETVAEAGGSEWRDALGRALGLHGEEPAAAGAVELFRLVTEEARDLLDERQRAVVEHALAAAQGLSGNE
ncbi:MAG: nucleotidyltransferase domain-containing protein [Actinomycetota bacterium]|nr:nucleotidyltransferase domain-containing protein [Actinomycetota bacterium]